MAKARSLASTYAVSLVVLGLAFASATGLAIFFYTKTEAALRDADLAKADLSKNMAPEDKAKPAVVAALAAMETNKLTMVGSLAKAVDDLNVQLQLKNSELKDQKDGVAQATAEIEKKKSELAARQTELESIRATTNAKVKAAQDAGDQDKQAADNAKQEAQAKIAVADTAVKAAQDALNKAIEDHQKALEMKDMAVAAKEKEIAALKDEKKELEKRIRADHQPVPSDVATPVGSILETLENGDVILSLGSAERVRPGFTFEVFPSNSVIHLQAGNIVSGKATVEVYSVQDHDCVARLVRGAKTVHLGKGDVLVNLAYHPHAEQTFVVYGTFDINNTRNPNGTVEDENRIKALITSTGAKVLEFDTNNPQVILSPDTDYLVLGKEPKSPVEPTGDEATDVAKVEAYKKAQKNYQLYISLLNQARQMQVPVLNQNRFLELVGFYHRSKVNNPSTASK